jgi:hypothetical protein
MGMDGFHRFGGNRDRAEGTVRLAVLAHVATLRDHLSDMQQLSFQVDVTPVQRQQVPSPAVARFGV